MEPWLYVMFIEKTKSYNKLTKAAVERHVANLKALDEAGHIELAGVFKGYTGVAGMYILKAESYEAAEALCRQEPLVVEGFATYKLKALQPANRENNYLL
ncbi:hypothetical protein D1646_13405 [Pseudoflavonifractor sp. 60]|uniref:YciI family protein n=1 Tax=Pseudoflavonifractor sp. 60 TaxID=2304576 RepID=UPI00136B3B77|nr:YciI family protein [Pseudoflavonifractor sp. 60]NBI67781.1 hypothetical protein [Pseudoflavonifractor sp. 60]